MPGSSELNFNRKQIHYLDSLPDEYLKQAAELYFSSLHEKLVPILGNDERATRVVADSIVSQKGTVAICDNNLVGIIGFQTKDGGFLNPSLKSMIRAYGLFNGLLRLAGLAVLHHPTNADEIYIDGIAVHPGIRGNGIGTHLLGLLESTASKKGIKRISLDVIDTNPKAQALYERLGFVAMKTQSIRPLNLLIKFPFRSVTFMVKDVGSQQTKMERK